MIVKIDGLVFVCICWFLCVVFVGILVSFVVWFLLMDSDLEDMWY